MIELPSELTEVSSVRPGISPTCRSIGAATVAAITSGEAPGYCVEMNTAGKSTDGNAATGSWR